MKKISHNIPDKFLTSLKFTQRILSMLKLIMLMNNNDITIIIRYKYMFRYISVS